MDSKTTYLKAIGANLMALRAILTDAMRDVDNGLEAALQGNQNGAVGSILPAELILGQAGILIQAILILHRQS